MRAAVFPYPFDESEWLKIQHPLLRKIALRMMPLGVEFVKSPHVPTAKWLWQERNRIDIIHIHWPEIYYYPSWMSFTEQELTWLKRLSHLIKLDYLYIVGVVWFFAFISMAALLKIPVVWTMHDLYPHYVLSKDISLERKIRTYLMRRMGVVIYNCENAKQASVGHFGQPKKGVVVPLGNYRDFYPDTITREKAREELGINLDETLFLFFGNQRVRRNAIKLMKAFRKFDKPNARLLIAGSAPSDIINALENIKEDDIRIKFLFQNIANEKIEVLFKGCDFVIMPAQEYLTSAVILLSISYGRPVLACDFGCASEMIGDAGILFDAETDESLLLALEKAMDSDRDDLFQKAQVLSEKLDWELTARKTLVSYELALNVGTIEDISKKRIV